MNTWIFFAPMAFVVLLLAGLGCAIRFGKAYNLIKGYNALPEDQKKNVDIQALARFTGNGLFAMAGLFAAMTALFALNLAMWALGVAALVLIAAVYQAVRSRRFLASVRREGGMSAQTKITIALLVVVLGGVAAGVTALIHASAQPVRYEVGGGVLKIDCMFGETVQLSDIKGLETVQAMPGIASRTDGSAVGDALRGSFDLADGKAAQIYFENANPPFIHFTAGGTEHYLNGKTPDDTIRLYDELKKALS